MKRKGESVNLTQSVPAAPKPETPGKELSSRLRQSLAPISVAIVEDDRGIRESLASFLGRAAEMRCVAVYPNAEQALEGIPALAPDVVLMDINLPGMSGIEATRALKRRCPDLRILMLTVYEDNKALFDSLKAGACGYLLKRAASGKLVEAIYEAREGGMPLTPRMAAKVAGYFQTMESSGPAAEAEPDEVDRLAPRERQVLELLAQGFVDKEIADRMAISPQTVHGYTKRIYEKLHVRSRTEAAVKFLKR